MDAAASVITIAALAWQLSITLTKLIREIKEQNEDVQLLEDKAESLGAIIKEVENAYKPKDGHINLIPGGPGEESVRNLVVDATSRCASDLKKFEAELETILSKRRGLAGAILKRWRLQVAGPAFSRIEKSIEGHQLSLHLLIQLQHGHSLESTRQMMAQGFAALLTQNRQMYAMLQGMADPPGVPLNRQDTQATLVPPSENEEQAPSALENDNMLHQFFEGIFAVWLKNMSADGSSPASSPLPIPAQPLSPLPSKAAVPSPSPNQSSFGETYNLSKWRSRRQSSPGVGPKEADSIHSLQPMTHSLSSQSHASRISHESAFSMATRSTSQSEGSHMSESSRQALRRARASRARGSDSATPRVKIDLDNCEPEDREKGIKLLDHVKSSDLRTMESLIEDGATLEEEDKNAKTPLLLATDLGKVDAAHLLIQKGANITAIDKNEQTALHLAVRRRSAHAIIPALITATNSPSLNAIAEDHPFINRCDANGRTALHECARFGMLEPAKTLLDHGADINARDFAGLPPAYFAMSKRNYEITALLLSKDADFSSFQWPPADQYGGSIEKLLKKNGVQRPGDLEDEDAAGSSAPKKLGDRRPSRSFRLGRRKDSMKS